MERFLETLSQRRIGWGTAEMLLVVAGVCRFECGKRGSGKWDELESGKWDELRCEQECATTPGRRQW